MVRRAKIRLLSKTKTTIKLDATTDDAEEKTSALQLNEKPKNENDNDLALVAGRNLTDGDASQDGFALFDENSLCSIFEYKSNTNFERKFLLMQKEAISGQIYSLSHPKSGEPTLYLINEYSDPYELLQLDHGKRSFFYGDSVVAEGSIIMFFPIHPLFLAIGHFQEIGKNRFISLTELLELNRYPGLKELSKNEKLLSTLKLTSDWRVEENETIKFSFNEQRLLDWLENRFKIVKNSLSLNTDEDQNTLDEHCFGILSDYLPESLSNPLKERLNIKTTEWKDKLSRTNKRISAAIETTKELKDGIITPARKRIKKHFSDASKGTPSLTSFLIATKNQNEDDSTD